MAWKLLEAVMLRNAELEAMVKQNSGNSSKPPNSDLGRKRKPPVEPSGRYRMPRRETLALAKDLFGVRMSLGSVQACCNAVSEAVADPTAASMPR